MGKASAIMLAVFLSLLFFGCTGGKSPDSQANQSNANFSGSASIAPGTASAPLAKSNVSACKSISDPKENAACYLEAFEKANDTGICDSLAGAMERGVCFGEVAKATGDPSFCGRESGPWADYCFEQVGTKLQDISLCKAISNPPIRSLCYMTIGVETGNLSVCDLVEDVSSTDVCIGQIAINTRDPSLCAKLSPGANQDLCYSKSGSS